MITEHPEYPIEDERRFTYHPTDGDPLVVVEDQERPLIWLDRVVRDDPEYDDDVANLIWLVIALMLLVGFATGFAFGRWSS